MRAYARDRGRDIAVRDARTALTPFSGRDRWPVREPLPRPPRLRPAARRGRRHGRAHLGRRPAASAVPRRRTSARPRASSPCTRATSRAGAELIETNTFGANRRKLAARLLEDEFEEINSAGVRLAREAREVAGRDVFIAGSIGPLGELEVFDPPSTARSTPRRRACSRGVASTCSWSRRSSTSTSSSSRSRRCAPSRRCRSSRSSPSTTRRR